MLQESLVYAECLCPFAQELFLLVEIREVIHFNCEATEQDWLFTLEDNGMGIAEEHQQKVFQLFHTLAAKDTNDSTGVGLSLIEKSITNWGGKISLQSTLGKGCKFTFSLPKERNINE